MTHFERLFVDALASLSGVFPVDFIKLNFEPDELFPGDEYQAVFAHIETGFITLYEMVIWCGFLEVLDDDDIVDEFERRIREVTNLYEG